MKTPGPAKPNTGESGGWSFFKDRPGVFFTDRPANLANLADAESGESTRKPTKHKKLKKHRYETKHRRQKKQRTTRPSPEITGYARVTEPAEGK